MQYEDSSKSSAETDEIALKWFEIAAKGGITNGMIALAHKILSPNGLKVDSRLGIFWLTEAIERGAQLSVGSLELFEKKTLLIREISAWTSKESVEWELICQFTSVQGADLGTLLITARLKEILEW